MRTWQDPTMTVVASLADAEFSFDGGTLDFKFKKEDKKPS